ncbi:hypothetical protein G3O08_09665 [Cryomorpha ignava]|uniref:SDR family oxidoreductase n=1 Tax=Cryomorpha ignava TaxID=101383 RepID=A0A7K3WQ39_9FLAO|nr:hypothetical protein [Cryomorpha ignava]NEN23767.1 hypothetical protein [Cryomorpha ignava]
MKVSIIGLGWYGKPLAEKLSASYKVVGTKSSRDGVSSWDVDSVSAHYLNLNEELDYAQLKPVFDVDVLILNIPPSAAKTTAYSYQMMKILEGIKKFDLKHLIFISSTGVFGEHQINADEDTIPEPTRGNGEVLKRAENYLAENFAGRLSIIRPGGLVGGERHPAKYLAGRENVSGKNHPVNLVHRKDFIALTQFLIENKTNRSCFHAIASKHPLKKEFYIAAAEKMGLKKPEFDEGDMSGGKLILGDKTQAETIDFEFNDPFEMA